MSPRRKLFFLLLVALFIVSAPLITLYTAGYRVFWKKQTVERVGFLEISTIPTKANVYLDNNLMGTTPYVNTSVIPGDYQIRVEKAGYRIWNSEVDIRSGSSALFTNLLLWKESNPSFISAAPSETSFSSRGDWLASVQESTEGYTAFLGPPNAPSQKEVCRFTKEAPVQIIWNSTGTLALFVQKITPNLKACVGGTTSQSFDLDTTIKSAAQSVYWATFSPTHLLIQTEDGDYTLEATRLEKTKVGTDNEPFTIRGANFYSLKPNPNKTVTLYMRELNESAILAEQTLSSGNYEFQNISEKLIALTDTTRQITVLFQAKDLKPSQTISANRIIQEPKNKAPRLLAYNEFELYLIPTDYPIPVLLTRFSKPIRTVLWHPLLKHALVFNDSQILAMPLEAINDQKPTVLATFDAVSDLWIDKNGNDLLILGSKDGQNGVWKLQLKD
ncbi:MAG: PEGA domain-containing protein [bacterium]